MGQQKELFQGRSERWGGVRMTIFFTMVLLFSIPSLSVSQEPFEVIAPSIVSSPHPSLSLGEKGGARVRYGTASWYSETDPGINLHTANGEIFDDSALTCATWDDRFGTRLKVTNLANGQSVICRVNDRGPARRLNRVIDLTQAAFKQIADSRRGLIEVAVTKLS